MTPQELKEIKEELGNPSTYSGFHKLFHAFKSLEAENENLKHDAQLLYDKVDHWHQQHYELDRKTIVEQESEIKRLTEENEKLKQIINGTHCSCPYHQKINETDVGKELKRLTEEKEKYRKALEDIKQGFVIGRDSDGDPIQEQVYPSERAQQALHQENK